MDKRLLISKKVALVVGPNIKVWSNVILVLPNLAIELSNMREKKKVITECDKGMVKSDVGTAQCNNEIIKCDKKKRRYAKCYKSTVKCDVGTT